MHHLLRVASLSFFGTFAIVGLGALHQQLGAAKAAVSTTPAADPGVAMAVVEDQLSDLSGPTAWVEEWADLGEDSEAVEAVDVVPADAHLAVSGLDLVLSPAPGAAVWSPPAWYPADHHGALRVLEGIDADPIGLERKLGPLTSRAVFVYDLGSGEVLFAKNADDRRPVASLTKVVSSLGVVAEQPNLDAEVCLDLTARVGWPGARARLGRGTCTSGWDMLGAALVKSDNGAAYGFPEVAGIPYFPFIARMNTVAADLGMDQSSFSDPSGVDDDNLSTARDMTRAVIAATLHPQLAPIVNAPYWDVTDSATGKTRRLGTTNSLIDRPRTDVLGGKTGYTDTARYCFTGIFQLADGRTVAVTTLGAPRNRNRWADVRTILSWVEANPG
jgi:D-alanyl-D-alanine endopeptidase (penicillin-binding protein 7)